MDTVVLAVYLIGYACSLGWRLSRRDGRVIREPSWVVLVVGGAVPFLVVALIGTQITVGDERLPWLAAAVLLYLGWVAVSMVMIVRHPQDGSGVFVHLLAGLPALLFLSVWWR